MPFSASRTKQFWKWFKENRTRLESDKLTDKSIKEITRQVKSLHSAATWEVGPGAEKANQFVISPNLDPEAWSDTRKIVSLAPKLEDWEFYSERPPKKWDMKFSMGGPKGEKVSLDASKWEFVLLEYPDKVREIVLLAEELPPMTKKKRTNFAAVFLVSLIGEDFLLKYDPLFSLEKKSESQFRDQGRPIDVLRSVTGDAVAGDLLLKQ
jgi:hypothetical protein